MQTGCDEIRARTRTPRTVVVAIAAALASGCAGAGEVAGRAFELFAGAGEERAGGDSVAPRALRYRPVRLNPEVVAPGATAVGDRLAVSGFGERSFVATVDRVHRDSSNVLSIRGRVDGGGHLLLSLDRDRAFGTLEIPEQAIHYAISPEPGSSLHLLEEADPRAPAEVREPGPPLRFPSAASGRSLAPGQSEAVPAEVDVMVVYTPRGRDFWASRGGIDLVVSQALERGQLALDNSRLASKLRLVHSALVDYQEVDTSQDLRRLARNRDGFMDEVHEWRDRHGADLVMLVSDVEDYCGRAYLATPGGDPEGGFGVVATDCLTGLTVIHELGHNFGADHRKDQPESPGPGLFPFSAGWRWIGQDRRAYCSVMSYLDAWDGRSVTRVAHFSSPLVAHQGVPTGDAADADNARTLREMAPVVSAYRPSRRFIYPPLDARGERVVNRSLSQVEYLDVLRWEPHPENQYVNAYRVYGVENGERRLLARLAVDQHEHVERGVVAGESSVYQIVAVDQGGLWESSPTYVTVEGGGRP